MGLYFFPRWIGKYAQVKNLASLRPADHIAIWDFSRLPFTYQHHGIVWASGDSIDTILICHIWSPLEGYQEAQADSHFRISTLAQFLGPRSAKHLRLVEYHTSGLRELLSSWGEVHFGKADLPEVVLERCKFLMGLGKGEFNIFTQNCEHAAHWCKTGQQWCKQTLSRRNEQVPFERSLPVEQVENLHARISQIKDAASREAEKLVNLSGTFVRVRLNGEKYLHVKSQTDQVEAVSADEDAATVFQLFCYAKGYNCVKLSFLQVESGKYMFSRSTLSCFRDVRMKKRICLRGTTGLKWEFTSTGIMKSMNQHRRYLGLRADGVVVDVSIRGDAARFELLPVSPCSQNSAPDSSIVLPEVRQPSTYNLDTTHAEFSDTEEKGSARDQVYVKL